MSGTAIQDTDRPARHSGQAIDPSPAAWETEVLVLHGEDRADLCRQVQALLDRLGSDRGLSLTRLAAALNADLAPGGCRLAVVAGSVAELEARLRRAAARLADPGCRQVNDRQGIYFTEQPLYPPGKLAVLFAGEGAQYLGMLGGLRGTFPEVAEHFQVCDRLSLEAGRREQPISRTFLPPAGATAAEHAAAERELWRLDNAVGSVLMTNWGVYHVLRGLGVEADAFAGHSAGEISALAGAGCIDADEFLFAQLFALGHLLRQQEDDGRIADAVLLATGANRQAAAELSAPLGPAVHVAMDNCPHQTVLAGPPEVMAELEAQLRGRGLVCERLPFRRPYHTPLFEPLLGPIARMFDVLPVRSPRKPVYSCTTARPFPSDPKAIRRLAVAHWASRVEFVRLIEAMYADGVRLFIESGPRGNLTSFVEDILRGRPMLAVAADVPRRTGLTQLNHLVGQLAVHHVPLRLEYLYRHRMQGSEVGRQGSGVRDQASGGREVANERSPSVRAEVVVQYCGVMEQFLDLQREVVESFLARRRQMPARGAQPVSLTPSSSPGPPVPRSPRQLPLLGEVVRHEAGRELLLRRRVDLAEDLYALDHTLGGRDASAIDPTHHGLPVMPMAFSVEMMAEAAAALIPGKRVLGMRRVRLHRWIPLDEEDPITLEVCARVQPDGSVQVEIRDRGNSSSWPRGAAETLAVDGTVLLGDAYPEPPPVDDFPLTSEGPCRYTPAQLYGGERRLFHGPLFQAVCSTDRQGEEGIEGHLRTLPHAGLFRSAPDADLITDPLLIDASTHVLGCWHLGRPDQAGRVVFPYELGTVQLYGPRPAVGTRIKCRVAVERSSARQVSHRIDLIGPDGRLWCRLHPAEYWRFYWPPEYTAYFRRKDIFLVGQRWDAALRGLTSPAPGCCMRISPPADLTHPVKRGALARVSLSRAEWRQFRTMTGPDARKTEWLFGRLAAKDAARALWHQCRGERLLPADLEITPDAHGRPVLRHLGHRAAEPMPAISISHTAGLAAALAVFDRSPPPTLSPAIGGEGRGRGVGIDVERVQPRGGGFEEIAFDATERALLDCFGSERDEGVARFWCAREAAAKALGRGQVEGPRSLAVRHVDRTTGAVHVALGPRLAEEFPELRYDLLIASTARDGEWVVATSLAERTGT
jgi:malonyl CoA-acyl carrier protein transacylase/phosphopantetheinyl transferase (holo-ACP synthase)